RCERPARSSPALDWIGTEKPFRHLSPRPARPRRKSAHRLSRPDPGPSPPPPPRPRPLPPLQSLMPPVPSHPHLRLFPEQMSLAPSEHRTCLPPFLSCSSLSAFVAAPCPGFARGGVQRIR